MLEYSVGRLYSEFQLLQLLVARVKNKLRLDKIDITENIAYNLNENPKKYDTSTR
jgi:hypothetical protein